MINLNNKLKNVKEIIVHMLCTCADDSTTKKSQKLILKKAKEIIAHMLCTCADDVGKSYDLQLL